MIRINHIQKEYPNVTPLKDVNVEIHKGDVISVIGPSGTGKSTLIKRIMEELVIPNIDDLYQRERAKDELPQSGSGRTDRTAPCKRRTENRTGI